MNIGENDIKNFQDIFEREYGYKISNEEASELGVKLVDLMKYILPSKDNKIGK